MQGRTVDSLWDSGASACLVTHATATFLCRFGAVRTPIAKGVLICGIGDGEMRAIEQLHAIITFSDGIAREIEALIVPNCPHELIIGLNFMQANHIMFCPLGEDGRFQLRDGKLPDMPVIYDSAEKPSGHVIASAMEIDLTESERMCAEKVASCNLFTQVSDELFDEVEKDWLAMPDEDRELIELLNSVKLADVSCEEMNARLSKTKFFTVNSCTQTEQVNSVNTTELKVPICDFPEVQAELENLILKHQQVFSSSSQDVGKSTGRRVVLNLKTDEPVNERNYRTAMKLRPILLQLVNDLLAAEVIEKCTQSEYNSPCLLVPKKADPGGEPGYRLVIDYRGLNKILENVVYPMPRIQDLLSEFQGCKVFSNVDIRHAFFTIELHPDSRAYTAFSCEFGKWQFKFLPQGLKISPAIFQGQITEDLRGLDRTEPYMDDILTGDPKPRDQLVTLDRLLGRLGEKGYKLKLSKCLFIMRCVPFLGSNVTENGIAISDDKKKHAREMTKPRTLAEVKSLLGFSSFLRAHIPYYCDIVYPIQALLSLKNQTKNMNIVQFWTGKCDLVRRLCLVFLSDL